MGPRFAGPRQGLTRGSAPSTPDRSALPAEVHGLSHGSRLDAATRDPTPPATDTMSPNPAAWCVRIAPRVGRGVVPLRYERADDGFGRGVQRRGKLGVRRGAPLPLPGRSVQHCVGWLDHLRVAQASADGPPSRTSGHRPEQRPPGRCGQAPPPRCHQSRGRRGRVRSPWRWRRPLPRPAFHPTRTPQGREFVDLGRSYGPARRFEGRGAALFARKATQNAASRPGCIAGRMPRGFLPRAARIHDPCTCAWTGVVTKSGCPDPMVPCMSLKVTPVSPSATPCRWPPNSPGVSCSNSAIDSSSISTSR